MNSRRAFITTTLGSSAAMLGLSLSSRAVPFSDKPSPKPEGAFRILHMTDLHIRPEYEAPRRYRRIISSLEKEAGAIDLILNGGDSIYAADYDHITRERTLEQWKLWDDVVLPPLKGIEMLSALGNHDMWWAAPDKHDPMYGKDYVLKRLGQTQRYMSIERGGWLIITLDCNNSNLLDNEQREWLHAEMQRVPDKPLLIMSHQPIALAEAAVNNGINRGQKEIINPFLNRKVGARPVHFVSGHIHTLDTLSYANVHFHCNGALSGAWWEPHINDKDCSVQGTPMGYAIIDLSPDGRLANTYHEVTDCNDGKIVQ